MSGHPYIDADTLEDIRNAHACGVPFELLAAQAGTVEDDLRRRLGLPRRWTQPVQGDLFSGQPQQEGVSDR